MTNDDADRRRSSATLSDAAASVHLLTFRLDQQRYALRSPDVVEVQRMVALVELPGAPAIVEGFVDLRGACVPVLDVRQRFGLADKDVDPADHLVFARAGARLVGLRVDAALGLIEIAADRVDTTAVDLAGVAHVEGLAHDDEGLVVIHDLATFLSLDEAQQLDHTLTAVAGS